MKGFGIEIKNNLLEPKHIEAMGHAVWLYMYLLDKVTSITEEQVGIVLGGKPIKFEDVKKELGITKNTYTIWLNKLKSYPYIQATRTPFGFSFKVYKVHKRFTKNSDSHKTGIGNPKKADSDSHKTRNPIKTITVDNNSRHIIYKGIDENDVVEIADRYKVSPGFVKLQLEALQNYCESKGKTYRDYKAALRNFVLSEMKKHAERRSYATDKVSIDTSNL